MQQSSKILFVAMLLLSMGALFLFWPAGSAAQDPDELLKHPLVLGAWLYEGNCVRCHGPYERERVGKRMDEDELQEAIESGGCQITWGRKFGGPFSNQELKAIVNYILTWEELGGAPDLPELPAQPTPTPMPTRPPSEQPTPTPTPIPQLMDERTRFIVSKNPVAHGAWLWTQYCYRCHLAYAEARQGRDADREDLQKIIEEGKVATQMNGFSRQFGGELKSREIDNIVHYIYTFEALDAPPALPDGILVPPTPDPAKLIPVALPEVPLVEGDAQHGEQLYSLHCERCHAAPDEGGLGPRLARDWHSVRPDLTVKSAITLGVPGSLMPAWGQEQEGTLAEQDINDLVAYVLSWSPQQESPALFARASASSPVWSGWLGFLALLAGPLLLGTFAFMATPERQRSKDR